LNFPHPPMFFPIEAPHSERSYGAFTQGGQVV
jgi:hypothetical protein